MADYYECPRDNETCIGKECEYYDEGVCELKICMYCRYRNDYTKNCEIVGGYAGDDNWCTDGEFDYPFAD